MNQATAHLHWSRELGLEQADFFADGMHCAGCARSIRRHVGALPGVRQVDVNLTTGRVSVAWNPGQSALAKLLDEVRRLGFRPVPLIGSEAEAAQRQERRRTLKRIGLAGLAAMQMSMYTVGLYIGAVSGIDSWLAQLLRVTAMLISVPVMFYSGAPFLSGAWHALRRRTLGMDVPVAAALLLAFTASVINTWRGHGEIYFDSVAMFIFFLLLGRYLEMSVRRGSLDTSEALARSLPAQVTRLRADGASERVALERIAAGDRVLVAQGGVVPVDCVLESAATTIDESLLTGESAPIVRTAGLPVPGGAINLGPACLLLAQCDASSSTLASMAALIERAQAQRPPQALAADRIASRFVFWIVLLALLVAGFWLFVDPARAFEATLAVLVVTCPCALSLATPVVIAAATTRLARRGVLVTRVHALERLAAIDTVVLDKTGTLSGAHLKLGAIECLRDTGRELCLAIAASLEQQSSHPLASAFTAATTRRVDVNELRECAGRGLEGTVAGQRWRLGQLDYVSELSGVAEPESRPLACDDDHVWLGSARGLVAAFALVESLRPEAAPAIGALRSQDLQVAIASGDRHTTVRRIATELAIGRARGRMDPQAKLDFIHELQQQGHSVLMVGDGINDGPVLAAANVSCAMGGGAALAHAAADLLLMNESLLSLAAAVDTARRAAQLVRANLRWALGYNLCTVPLAAAGLIPPWLAALGMSASSLYVVVRAQRFVGQP